MLRVANLCAELTSRNQVLMPFWNQAAKSLHHRAADSPRDRVSFNDYFTKIPIQTQKCKENFKTFLAILASRHCIVLNELIIMVVRVCVMACPGSKLFSYGH